jgi:hypothetical protein
LDQVVDRLEIATEVGGKHVGRDHFGATDADVQPLPLVLTRTDTVPWRVLGATLCHALYQDI